MVGLGLVSMPKLLPPLQKTAPSSFKVSDAFQLPFAAMNHRRFPLQPIERSNQPVRTPSHRFNKCGYLRSRTKFFTAQKSQGSGARHKDVCCKKSGGGIEEHKDNMGN